MRMFSDVVDDQHGNIQPGIPITVKLNGVAATIYSDSGGLNPVNPVTTDPTGIISFYYNQSGIYTFWNGATQIGSRDLQDLSPTTGATLVGSDDGASGSLWTTVAGFISYLFGSGGASRVGFSHATTYASGSVGQKLKTLVCVTDAPYNAAANNSTDDTTAVQAAINHAATIGGAVFFPGICKTQTLTIPSGVSLIGIGAMTGVNLIDDGTSTSRSIYLSSVNDVSIESMLIDCSNATSRTGVYGLVRSEGCARVKIKDNKFLRSPSVAVFLFNTTDFEVSGNTIGDGTKFCYADGIHVTRACKRGRIAFNTIRDTQDDAIGLPSNKDGGTYGPQEDIIVHGNVIYTPKITGRGISVAGGNRISVTANIIDTPYSHGINAVMAGDATYNSGVDFICANNQVYNAGVGGSASACGIAVSGLNGGSVTGNTVRGAASIGVELIGTSLNVNVHGNRAFSCGGNGIYEEAGSGPNVFTANILSGNTGTPQLFINGATGSKRSKNTGDVWTAEGEVVFLSADTTKTVTHGLAATPTLKQIRITQAGNTTNDTGNLWVDTITSTTFNVNCRAAPGASGMPVEWYASLEQL